MQVAVNKVTRKENIKAMKDVSQQYQRMCKMMMMSTYWWCTLCSLVNLDNDTIEAPALADYIELHYIVVLGLTFAPGQMEA